MWHILILMVMLDYSRFFDYDLDTDRIINELGSVVRGKKIEL